MCTLLSLRFFHGCFQSKIRFPGHARRNPVCDLPAARSGRVFAGNTHLFSRSGPRLVDGVEALARVLHPEAFADRLPVGQALKVSQNGERLEPYR